MDSNHLHLNGSAAASGGLAAAIAMAISVIVGLFTTPDAIGQVLLMAVAMASIAFGGTYASVFFVGLARAPKRNPGPAEA